MSHTNRYISFLRHYGPIPASDNMYDELIQAEIDKYKIYPPIRIEPAKFNEIKDNFECSAPFSVILTGTAGDGKTYHCRLLWEYLGGDKEEWHLGKKIMTIDLPRSNKKLVIIKDLSELKIEEKDKIFPELTASVLRKNEKYVFLIAANDGQLIASWREWALDNDSEALQVFKIVEGMLVEERNIDSKIDLYLYNLSRIDAALRFDTLIECIVEHPQWEECKGCELFYDDGTSSCPIRLNRELLQRGIEESTFRNRLGDLLRLSGANRLHLPIRDLLLLGVNIILGDKKGTQPLLTCRSAKNRAENKEYSHTSPFSNTFGANLKEKDRIKYQVFTTLDSFGIGRETDNQFDNLLVYGSYIDKDRYEQLVGKDIYGAPSYNSFLRDYLEGERELTSNFMDALEHQRRRLFFSLPDDSEFDPWKLSVYQYAGQFNELVKKIDSGEGISRQKEKLVRGLNRTFSGMMIDEGTMVYLTSSGGDGRRRIASILSDMLHTSANRRNLYLDFSIAEDKVTPQMRIIDPTLDDDSEVIGVIDLQLTHFEYLMRVANGSLPASFSRQCYEDFLDLKLFLIERITNLEGDGYDSNIIELQAIRVDVAGQAQIDDIRIQISES